MTGNLLNIWFIIGFLKERKQRVFLNDQHSKLSNISVGALQGLILGPLLFLIYIQQFTFKSKGFPVDTLIVSVLHDINQSGINLNDDFQKISTWNFRKKISFNPDINKEAEDVTFFC